MKQWSIVTLTTLGFDRSICGFTHFATEIGREIPNTKQEDHWNWDQSEVSTNASKDAPKQENTLPISRPSSVCFVLWSPYDCLFSLCPKSNLNQRYNQTKDNSMYSPQLCTEVSDGIKSLSQRRFQNIVSPLGLTWLIPSIIQSILLLGPLDLYLRSKDPSTK